MVIQCILIINRRIDAYCVIPFTKITMFPYSEQFQDIELYGASVGDDLDVK